MKILKFLGIQPNILQVFLCTHLYVLGMFLAFFSMQVIEHCDQLLHSAHEWQSGLWQMASSRFSPLHVLFGQILCRNLTPPIPHDFEHLDHSVHSVQVSNSDVAKVTFLTRCAPMNSFAGLFKFKNDFYFRWLKTYIIKIATINAIIVYD